jgi:fructosamine-3-kinase
MSLPAALLDALQEDLRAAGDESSVQHIQRVGGGDINQAARLITTQASYFVKWHASAPPRFFEAEADGLRRLREANALRVPEVIAHRPAERGQPAFLILEWIESASGNKRVVGSLLGERLAAQHRQTRDDFGLEIDNYIGSLPQPNTPDSSWVAFYRDQRLGVQRDLAADHGRLPPARARLLDRLMADLDRWLDDAVLPSLLHGDLWGGNYMLGPQGEPVLIDPAVYYGDREIELAFTKLFGGFSGDFYDAYQDAYPLPSGHEERVPLYQLYHLLTHLNLFGESYGGSVDSILRRYVG